MGDAEPSAAHKSLSRRIFIVVGHNRSHASLEGHTPLTFADGNIVAPADLNQVRWVSHCRDLVQLPVAA